MNQLVDTNTITARLASLSEPIRLRTCRLLERQELSVGEVARVLQLPQSTVSRHLKILSEAGWLIRRSEGTATLYRLVLDDLTTGARTLWVTVRDQMDDDATHQQDLRRLEAVLAERRTDSQTFFGQVANEWDQLRGELFGRHFTAPALLSLIPRGWTVADFGCGTGNVAAWLAPHVNEVIAIDRADAMLKAAQKRLAEHENVRFLKSSIEDVSLEDSAVDAATCLLVLHFIEDPLPALREMNRVVRPGGRVLVVDMYTHDRSTFRHSMGHLHTGFAPEAMCDLLLEAGFEDPIVVPLPTDPNARGPGIFAASATAPGA